jgi:hypothetical protein
VTISSLILIQGLEKRTVFVKMAGQAGDSGSGCTIYKVAQQSETMLQLQHLIAQCRYVPL